MKKHSLVNAYLQNYSLGEKWELTANETDNISQVVVIPAFAERETLLHTLESLAQNPPSSLEHSFIMCVVNNGGNAPSAAVANNLQTIEYLDALVKKKSLKKFNGDKELCPLLANVSDAKLKLGYIDASSPGYEMPDNTAGVGMARKIGMDMALRLLKNSSTPVNLILSLDSDTLVQNNYLDVIRNYFTPELRRRLWLMNIRCPGLLRNRRRYVVMKFFCDTGFSDCAMQNLPGLFIV